MEDKVVRRIRQMCQVIEAMGQELQEARAERDQARAWAKAWKRAAKVFRRMAIHYHNMLYAPYAAVLKSENDRLRKALGWYVGKSAESLMWDGGRHAAEALSGGPSDE